MNLTKKILIVEDEQSMLKALTDKLSGEGFLIIQATNGQKGLDMAKKEHPDLILLDIIMPVMDGMTMLNLLRNSEEGKKTKVIMLTNIEPDDKIIGQVIGDQPAYYFVKSDIALNDLLDKIKELLAE